MYVARFTWLPLVILFFFSPILIAQETPSYSKHIGPFFKKYCVECHNEKKARSGLNLETFKSLKEGGDHGPAVVANNADESRLVLMLEGLQDPKMPPEKAELQPKAKEIALVRAWVKAGAKFDKEASDIILPAIKSKVLVSAPVSALAYLPDGKLLVVGNYKDLVICDTSKGDILGKLPGFPQPVTSLAASKDGKLLAVGLGMPGVPAQIRIYGILTGGTALGKPLDMPAVHDDMILQLAFSPDGKQLISCGYDRLVKIWDTGTGKIIHSLKQHSDSVYGVAFRPDGKLFATCAADRAVKVWETVTGKLLYTLSESTDWLYAAAWSPDGQFLAAGGVDKSIRVWKVNGEGGKIEHSVFAHQGPILRLVYAGDGKTLFSLSEDRIIKAWDAGKMVERKVFDPQPEAVLSLAVNPQGKQLSVGRYDGVLVLMDEATGKVQAQPLPAKGKSAPTLKIAVQETEPNNSPGTGQKITLPATVIGTIEKAGDVDYFRFEAKPGQQLGVKVQVVETKGKKQFDPFLRLTNETGQVLVQTNEDYLGYTFTEPGWYSLGIHDREFGGNPNMKYELRIGDVAVVTAIFPLGLQQGTEANIHVEGVNLEGIKYVKVKSDSQAKPGSKLDVPVKTSQGTPLGLKQLVVGEFPEVTEQAGQSLSMPVPGNANGIISLPGETDVWRFKAKKGQKLILEVNARRLGSELDSFIEVLDTKGNPLARATLRSQAKTYVTFRDHNSVQGNIRIEAWSELAVNDYIYVGTELLKIKDLPTHPDADCNFWTQKGARIGFLDTTPTHLSKGEPMYKVSLHPPGTMFPPNSFPVVNLYYRNDDGGPGYGRDSVIFFDPPQDGEYLIRIGDSQNKGGLNFAYRLTVRPPQPSFNIRFSPTNPEVWKGGAVPITVTADRIDGYDGPIYVRLENLPSGFSAPSTFIPHNEESTTFALWADANAKTPGQQMPWQLIAEATINGKKIRKEATGGSVKAMEPGEIVTTTEQNEFTIQPGGQAKVTLHIERRNGFNGRVPINVQGMPHGVKVLDIGLNGILITEKESQRTIVFYCEPWVQALEHPIVITAQREGKNTQHAAKSVLLKVVNAGGK